MRCPGLVILVLLGLSLWPDLGQALPKSQATFARDMRGDVMYNVADTGERVVFLSSGVSFVSISAFTFAPTDLFDGLKAATQELYCFHFANFSIY